MCRALPRIFALGLVAVAAVWAVSTRASRPDSLAWEAVGRDLRARYPNVPTITTASLAAWLADSSRTPPVLLDAREPAEVAVSHLPRARRVDPNADAEALAATLGDVDPARSVVIYCSVGVRSADIAERLVEAGYSDVRNLEGSIFRWANEGRPLVRDGRPVSEVHPYDAVWGRLLDPSRRARVE